MTCREWIAHFESEFDIPDEVLSQIVDHIDVCYTCRRVFIEEIIEFFGEESKDLREFLIKTPHDDLDPIFRQLKTDFCRRVRNEPERR